MGSISILDMILRIASAMLIGLVVGGQRTMTSHPAGLRTHTLVSLGACCVMLTGCMLFSDANFQFAATPDPARLGAQVISGIGFLGAGTIMREGLSVRGLTTAASLWTVACLGLAAGAGFYRIVFLGCLALFITLNSFDWLQARLRRDGEIALDVQIDCYDPIHHQLEQIEQISRNFQLRLTNFYFQRTEPEEYVVSFRVFARRCNADIETDLMKAFSEMEGVRRVEQVGVG